MCVKPKCLIFFLELYQFNQNKVICYIFHNRNLKLCPVPAMYVLDHSKSMLINHNITSRLHFDCHTMQTLVISTCPKYKMSSCPPWWIHRYVSIIYTLKAKDRRFDNFVVTDGICRNDNLRCHQWRQSCRIDDLFFSVHVLSLYIFNQCSWQVHFDGLVQDCINSSNGVTTVLY